jgi:ribosomal protein S18 acetylase RimI-like enzyme
VTNTPKHGIYQRQGLAADELADVRDLGQVCERYDRIDLRLTWGVLAEGAAEPPYSFLSYTDGALIGFLTIEGLGDDEAEATGMVHPGHRRQGVFRALVEAALAACRDAGTPTLVLYVDSRSPAAGPSLAALGATRAFSESKMRLADQASMAAAPGSLDIRLATAGDLPAIAAILADDMAADAQAVQAAVARNMGNPAYRYYIARLEGDPVGTLNVQSYDGDKYIYGFVVRQQYRGRGLGREILAHTLRDLAGDGGQPVYLEVEPDNTPAVRLYRSLGFETLATYDYYRLEV